MERSGLFFSFASAVAKDHSVIVAIKGTRPHRAVLKRRERGKFISLGKLAFIDRAHDPTVFDAQVWADADECRRILHDSKKPSVRTYQIEWPDVDYLWEFEALARLKNPVSEGVLSIRFELNGTPLLKTKKLK